MESNVFINQSKVVFVEDNDRLRNGLLDVFQHIFQCRVTESAEECLRLLESDKPDLIVLDILLPGTFDGFSLIRSLRNEKKYQDVAIIVISGLSQDEHIQFALELGANDYLVKPINFTILRQKINALVNYKKCIIESTVLQKLLPKASIIENHDDTKIKNIELLIDDLINNDYNLSIRELAKKMNVSLSTFERMIKRKYKVSPQKYLLHRKLEKANLLLSTNQGSIKNIAFTLGFNSAAYFTKCYREKYGYTPRKTRTVTNN